jgi:arylsulfatase A-like enzyme
MTSRRRFLSTAVAAAVPAAATKQSRPPNVLFILPDEWRAQSTGYNRDPNVQTPVLDRLARESVSFDNAVSNTPVCCPARASLMTGQYPLTNGVFINDVELTPNAPTLAEVFARGGYRTGYIGKWHLYGSPDGNYGRRLAYIPTEKRLGFDYWKACECSHEYNHSLYYEGNDATPKYWPGYDADAQTDDACQFIEAHAKSDSPFFLFLSLGPPHFPYETAPEKYRERFANHAIQFRPNVPDARRAEAEPILRGYFAHMAALDDCLGRLLATLDRQGIADDTIVVFSSDHGDMMWSQGITTKLHPWDESIRVPFLVRYPRRLGRRGRRARTPLSQPDIMPTLLRLTGLEAPGAVQGIDRSPLLLGGKEAGDSAALISLPVPITEARRWGFAEYRGVRTERYTYVRSINGPWLLYDNVRDPYQMRNLISRPEHKALQSSLDRALDAQLKRIGDDFLPAADYVRRAKVGHYKEVNAPIGHIRSPWGDWESTLAQSKT